MSKGPKKNYPEKIQRHGKSVLDHILKHNREALDGKYRQEIQELLGLSEIEIHMMTGRRVDRGLHEELISTVMEASRLGLPEDELKTQIMELGEEAVVIARAVPRLALLFC